MNKKTIITAAVSVFIVLAAISVYLVMTQSTPNKGMKSIKLTVVTGEIQKEFEIKTEREFLADALLDEGLIEGEESSMGILIKKVNGVEADGSKEEWWCLTEDGEPVMVGASSFELKDENIIELTLTVGY